MVFGGPVGAVIGAATGPIVEDVLSRLLSKKEKQRIEKVAEYAVKKINEQLQIGISPIKNPNDPSYKELFEGTLLAARDSFEDKKIPLLANLVATAPFTSTPTDNLVQTLKTAESLSYRQLCILSVLGKSQNGKGLSDISFREKYPKTTKESIEGTLFDVYSLIGLGLIAQMQSENNIEGLLVIGDIIPNKLRLFYPGRLLFNGLQLDAISDEELKPIEDCLK